MRIGNIIVTDDDIADIWQIAVEGGINDWCGLIKVKQGDKYVPYKGVSSLLSGNTLVLFDIESDDKWELTKSDMYKAIEICAKKYPWHIFTDGDVLDFSAMDAIDCDSIVQIACMGDIIFG